MGVTVQVALYAATLEPLMVTVSVGEASPIFAAMFTVTVVPERINEVMVAWVPVSEVTTEALLISNQLGTVLPGRPAEGQGGRGRAAGPRGRSGGAAAP